LIHNAYYAYNKRIFGVIFAIDGKNGFAEKSKILAGSKDSDRSKN